MRHAHARQTGSKTTDHDVIGSACIAEDKTGDSNVGAGAHQSPGADIWQFAAALAKIVNFDQRYAGASVIAANNRGVIPRRQGSIDGGLQIVDRRNSGRLDRGLLSVSPIIVERDRTGSGVIKLE